MVVMRELLLAALKDCLWAGSSGRLLESVRVAQMVALMVVMRAHNSVVQMEPMLADKKDFQKVDLKVNATARQ